jgi:hypothetical protein
LYKQSQIWGGWDIWGTAHRKGGKGAKQSQLGRASGDRVPLSPEPRGGCTNKPSFPARPEMGAGRGSFDANRAKTKPISAGARLDLNHLQEKNYAVCTCLINPAKQSQFLHDADREIGVPGANRAKQSQFGQPGDDRVPLSPAPRGRCTNKANLPPRPEMGAGGHRFDANRAKQSQFRSTAGETLRLPTARQDLQCSGEGLGVMLEKGSYGI